MSTSTKKHTRWRATQGVLIAQLHQLTLGDTNSLLPVVVSLIVGTAVAQLVTLHTTEMAVSPISPLLSCCGSIL